MTDILSLIVALAGFFFVAFIEWPKFTARVREIRSRPSSPPPRASFEPASTPNTYEAKTKALRAATFNFILKVLVAAAAAFLVSLFASIS
jgi:hypothetical protein